MKKILTFLPILIFSFAINVFAATEYSEHFGTTTEAPGPGLYRVPDSGDSSVTWVSVNVGGSSGEIIWFDWIDSSSSWVEVGRSSTPGDVTAPANANGFRLKSLDGGEVFLISSVSSAGTTFIYGDQSGGGSSPDYSPILNDILNSSNANGEKLGEILNQIKTTATVSMGSVPAAPDVSAAGRIERNKPAEKPVFKDDSTYFSDTGNSTDSAGPLPGVPDVADWEGMSRAPDGAAEAELVKDGESVKDSEGVKDSELGKDVELGKEGELVKDSFSQDGELGKEGELVKDSFSQDGELSKDSFTLSPLLPYEPMTPSENFSSTNSMNQTYFYNQTEFYNVTE